MSKAQASQDLLPRLHGIGASPSSAPAEEGEMSPSHGVEKASTVPMGYGKSSTTSSGYTATKAYPGGQVGIAAGS